MLVWCCGSCFVADNGCGHPRIPRGDFARYIDVASEITPGYPRMGCGRDDDILVVVIRMFKLCTRPNIFLYCIVKCIITSKY